MIRKLKYTLASIGALIAATIAFFAVPSITGATAPSPSGSPASTTPAASAALSLSAAAALEQLSGIPVAEDLDITYDPAVYGQRWADIDRNGCDTRNDILRRDLTDVQLKPGTNGCVALSGTLIDPYTGETVRFERKSEGYQPVQIDHVYPRALAAAHGALKLTAEERLQFANDPLNLVTTIQNQVKGDSGPAEYMPAAPFGCSYSTRFVAVTAKYSLSLSPADRDALAGVLSSCVGDGVDVDGDAP